MINCNSDEIKKAMKVADNDKLQRNENKSRSKNNSLSGGIKKVVNPVKLQMMINCSGFQ